MSTTTAQRWICESCGFIYDPADGDPDGGIPPGTAFTDIPDTLVLSGVRRAQARLHALRGLGAGQGGQAAAPRPAGARAGPPRGAAERRSALLRRTGREQRSHGDPRRAGPPHRRGRRAARRPGRRRGRRRLRRRAARGLRGGGPRRLALPSHPGAGRALPQDRRRARRGRPGRGGGPAHPVGPARTRSPAAAATGTAMTAGPATGRLAVEADPEELGFDPARLDRIDRHFTRYVDDGRLPGWLVACAPGAHRPRRGGAARRRGRRPVERGHALAHLLDDQADHLGRGDDAVGARAASSSRTRSAAGCPRSPSRGCTSRARSAKPLLEPATEPIRVWHLLTHTAGLTYGFHHAHPVDELYRAAGFEWAAPRGPRPRRLRRGVGGAAAAVPARHGVELRHRHRRARPARRGRRRAAARRVPRRARPRPARHGRHRLRRRRADATASPRCTLPNPATGRARAADDGRHGRPGAQAPSPPARRRRRARLDGRRTTTASPGCCWARGELDGVRLLGTRTVDYMGRNHLPGGARPRAGRPAAVRRDAVRRRRLRPRASRW